jgi:hypothetical protein
MPIVILASVVAIILLFNITIIAYSPSFAPLSLASARLTPLGFCHPRVNHPGLWRTRTTSEGFRHPGARPHPWTVPTGDTPLNASRA